MRASITGIVLMALLLASLVAAYETWLWTISTVTLTDVSLSATVSNISNMTIRSASGRIVPQLQPFGLNLTQARVVQTSGNITVVIEVYQGLINVTLTDFRPGATAWFEVAHLVARNSPAFPNTTSIFGIYYPAVPASTQWDLFIRFNASSAIGSFSSGSLYIHALTDYREDIASYRVSVDAVLLIFFFLLYLLIVGIPASKLMTGRRYPFLTLVVAVGAAFAYIFVGSGYEVDYLPSLSFFRRYVDIPALYHADYLHIAGNLLYFIPIGLLMEVWLNLKKDFKSLLYYLVGFSFDGVVFVATLWRVLSGAPTGDGFGLSFDIIMLTVMTWLYLLENWGKVIRTWVDTLLALISGFPMAVLSNHALVLIAGGQFYSNLEESVSIAHIEFGVLIISTVSIVKIFTKLRDARTKRNKSDAVNVSG